MTKRKPIETYEEMLAALEASPGPEAHLVFKSPEGRIFRARETSWSRTQNEIEPRNWRTFVVHFEDAPDLGASHVQFLLSAAGKTEFLATYPTEFPTEEQLPLEEEE